MRPSWMLTLLLAAGAAPLAACDDESTSEPAVDPATAPFVGDLPALPAGTEIEPADGMPVVPGGVWRYRVRADDWQAPPYPVTQGGETVVLPFEGETLGLGETDTPLVRKTSTVLTVDVEGTPTLVRQDVEELLYVRASNRQVGPQVRVRAITIKEREVATERFVRELSRTYSPPYVLVEDTWKTGILATNYSENVRIDQTLQQRGDEEPEARGGQATVRVSTSTAPLIEPMECQYREGVRKIEVSDALVPSLTRTYWVQPGVGVVKWQFADTENVIYTLTETNLEPAPAMLCPACTESADCADGQRCVMVAQPDGSELGRCEG
ncbi:MAG: hypothetical protein H6702_04840 [Myxococcales bacterium]|nr:hypothetical protein [Myxococcales bacterium]